MADSRKGDVWAVILAGGESKRMGTPKMLLPFRGDTMLGNVIMQVKASGAGGIMVVLGAELEKIRKVAEEKSVDWCYNPGFREGMLSSVKCGIDALPPDAGAVMVLQGDQPLIKTDTMNIVIEAYRNSSKGIIIPVFEGKRGHPLLVDKKYRNEIKKLGAGVGLRALHGKFPGDILEIVTNDPGILKDFDTLEDYKNEINQ